MSTAVEKSPAKNAVVPTEREMEFVPFMAKEAIKLSVSIVQTMICVPSKSGRICNVVQAIRFMMLCKARGLNPFEGDAYLIGYDTKDGAQFSLITAHQAFLKRAETHPEYDGMDSGIIVLTKAGELVDREGDFRLEDDRLMGGWATVFFKERKHHMKKRLRLATFKKSYGRWMDDPEGMIVKCAEADALRSSFPTLLGGMYLEDELPAIIDVQSSPSNGNGSHSPLAGLTSKLKHKEPDLRTLADPEQEYHHPEPVDIEEESDPVAKENQAMEFNQLLDQCNTHAEVDDMQGRAHRWPLVDVDFIAQDCMDRKHELGPPPKGSKGKLFEKAENTGQ